MITFMYVCNYILYLDIFSTNNYVQNAIGTYSARNTFSFTENSTRTTIIIKWYMIISLFYH